MYTVDVAEIHWELLCTYIYYTKTTVLNPELIVVKDNSAAGKGEFLQR